MLPWAVAVIGVGAALATLLLPPAAALARARRRGGRAGSADEIVFARVSRDRILVTIGDSEQFKLRTTRRGNCAEAF